MRHLFCLAALFMGVATSAQYKLAGTILDSNTNEPVVGAGIEIKSKSLTTSSSAEGYYEFLNLANGTYTLEVTALGYANFTQDVELNGKNLLHDISLSSASPMVLSDVGELDVTQIRSIQPLQAAAVVTSVATERTPVAYWNVSKRDIAKLNNGQDLPQLLRFTPSVVTTSDAGNGVGYTGLRIRGSDASRINVTVNGIPLNDSESQGVFWVNTPDLGSSADGIQIQRGVGTSTNGAGAFGGTVKVNTLGMSSRPEVVVTNMAGSFNTLKHSVMASSGRFNNMAIEMRLSQVTSDGFLDRASSDLKSYYAAAEWDNSRTRISAVVFGGHERTYQSWRGTPQSRLENDEAGMLVHAANNGFTAGQTANLLNSGRTYNYYEYENQVDNYNQDHYQLHFSQRLGQFLRLNIAGHYTYGRGYFEQFRESDDLTNYGLSPVSLNTAQLWSDGTDSDGNPYNFGFANQYDWDQVEVSQQVVTDANGTPILDGSGNTLLNASAHIFQSDVVRRRWLENDFYGGVFSLVYNRSRLNTTLGGGWNRYDGDHFGELKWMEHSAGTNPGDLYYVSNGLKTDFNIYLKSIYRITEVISAYADLQYRTVDYATVGTDNDLRAFDIVDNMAFFNPKAGITWFMSRKDKVYASYAVANREPVRGDYVDAAVGVFPQPEELHDIEIGYQHNASKYYIGANLYHMRYTNQLVLTGQVNDVGTPLRQNVDNSVRQGVEVELSWNVLSRLNWWATATFGQSYISEFTEFVTDYDNDALVEIGHSESSIAFSPEVTAASVLTFLAHRSTHHDLEFAFQTKYVGDQYLDNTEDAGRMIEAFLVNDIRATYRLKQKAFSELTFNVWVHNVLDAEYSSNGYTYNYIYGGKVVENFYYPQAGRHFMAGLTLRF